MTSWEFADVSPVLTEAQAEGIVRDHGLYPEEARGELAKKFTLTADLLGWLGY